MRNSLKSSHGFFLTLGVIMLILPLLFLIFYYNGLSSTPIEDHISSMRCDELHYFVEDIRRDMQRSVTVFGRRAAVYSLDHVVETGLSLENYSFTCTDACTVDCDEFLFEDTGSEAAVAELILCGSLFGDNVTYMTNHTIPVWIDKIEDYADMRDFNLNMNVSTIKVIPADPWHFAVMVDYTIKASDKKETCYYSEELLRAESNTSIIGLEDPLYILKTEAHVMRYIQNCTAKFKTNVTAGCSKNGIGEGRIGGNIVFYSDIGNIPALESYCEDADPEVLGGQVLVLDQAGGIVCNSQVWDNCFNRTAPKHFAGYISYNPANVCDPIECPGSIPHVCDTGEMDDQVPKGGGFRDPLCEDSYIYEGDCVFIVNVDNGGCTLNSVFMGYNSNSTNTSCYYASDIVENYNSLCTGEDYPNGPCFFDRLDGRVSLSEKYVDQSVEYFNNPIIGLETVIDFFELREYNEVYEQIPVYPEAGWVDYLYWQNVSGCDVLTSCESLGNRLKMGCAHSHKYGVDTTCSNVSGCV